VRTLFRQTFLPSQRLQYSNVMVRSVGTLQNLEKYISTIRAFRKNSTFKVALGELGVYASVLQGGKILCGDLIRLE
jgi:hypothetical protein